jgi:hypothetical protein
VLRQPIRVGEYAGAKLLTSLAREPRVRKKVMGAMCQWLTPVILTTWEAEIGRILV